jgi:hypothetical protein
MIAPAVIEEIRRLLREGLLSQRQIAGRLGVSHGTVNAIVLGRRADIVPRPPQEDAVPMPAGSSVRCPGCGGRVQMPCLLCYVRTWQKRQCGTQPPLRPNGTQPPLRPNGTQRKLRSAAGRTQ